MTTIGPRKPSTRHRRIDRPNLNSLALFRELRLVRGCAPVARFPVSSIPTTCTRLAVSSTLATDTAPLVTSKKSALVQETRAGRWLVIHVGLVSVVASLAILILQQAAFRLLAPVIGSSVETWSTIIGVFLLG